MSDPAKENGCPSCANSVSGKPNFVNNADCVACHGKGEVLADPHPFWRPARSTTGGTKAMTPPTIRAWKDCPVCGGRGTMTVVDTVGEVSGIGLAMEGFCLNAEIKEKHYAPCPTCEAHNKAVREAVVNGRREGIREAIGRTKRVASGLLHCQLYGNTATGDGEREPYWQSQGAEDVVKDLVDLEKWWPEKPFPKTAPPTKEPQ